MTVPASRFALAGVIALWCHLPFLPPDRPAMITDIRL
jgi:hypothetical protein